MVSFDGFASGWFWCKFFITSAENGKTPLLVSSSRSQIAAFFLPSRTSLANLLICFLLFVGFLVKDAFFGSFLFYLKDLPCPYFSNGFTFFQHGILFSTFLQLCEVLCNIRESINIRALSQISRPGNFEERSFISFVSSLIKVFHGSPFGRSKRFLFQCTKLLYAMSIYSRYFISLSCSVLIVVQVISL